MRRVEDRFVYYYLPMNYNTNTNCFTRAKRCYESYCVLARFMYELSGGNLEIYGWNARILILIVANQ